MFAEMRAGSESMDYVRVGRNPGCEVGLDGNPAQNAIRDKTLAQRR